MVSVSHESPAETEARLRRVIRLARLSTYPQAHAFEEFPLESFAERVDAKALALVRDDARWSQLVPRVEEGAEVFAVWRFHFPEDADNSGFVGWLATHLKARFGTGVFVICGSNREDGGIYDYWGCPWHLRDTVLGEVNALVSSSI